MEAGNRAADSGLGALLASLRLEQSDPADLLHKGSRSESWAQVVAQHTSRERKDGAQSSEQKLVRLSGFPHRVPLTSSLSS